MDVAAFRVDGPRLSDIRAQRVVRVLVLRQHRQHIVEAGNPLEVGDARRSTDEGFWLLNIFIR